MKIVYLACIGALFAAACASPDSATDLNPEGPPMIRQIRAKDNWTTSTGAQQKDKKIFIFGSHESAVTLAGDPDFDQEHHSDAASALSNSFRIVMDEILVGNNLEEIECRGPVDDDVFARVPIGATPDDIASCTTPRDVLASTCLGANRVCICEKAGGCTINGTAVAEGDPVGVLDANQDGAADNTHFINGAVNIKCNGNNVPIDLDASYWTPSGNQNVPAQGGFDVLGPAIVLAPLGALPTNTMCGLEFSSDVVDKENNRVCAPADGDIEKGCSEGDVSAFTFHVQPLTITPQPDEGATIDAMDQVGFDANVPLAADTASKVTVTRNGAAFTTFTAVLGNMGRALFVKPDVAGWPTGTYIITLPTTIKDATGGSLPQAINLTVKVL